MEPLEKVISEMREAVAKTYAKRGDDPPPDNDEAQFNDALQTMDRHSSYAGMPRAITFLCNCYRRMRSAEATLRNHETPDPS